LDWKIPAYEASSKKDVKEYHDRMAYPPATACIYTDGSGIDNNIGAAAVCPKSNTIYLQYLGKEAEYNGYAAELCAIHLGLEVVKTSTQYTKCILHTDNQAAIQAVVKPGQQSGQSIILSILDCVEEIQRTRLKLTITIIWLPGYENIPGNEQVDVEAKRVAQSNGTLSRTFAHRAMTSAKNAAIHRSVNPRWEKEWEERRDCGQHLQMIVE
jgi:ribonuclease HI